MLAKILVQASKEHRNPNELAFAVEELVGHTLSLEMALERVQDRNLHLPELVEHLEFAMVSVLEQEHTEPVPELDETEVRSRNRKMIEVVLDVVELVQVGIVVEENTHRGQFVVEVEVLVSQLEAFSRELVVAAEVVVGRYLLVVLLL